MKHIHAYRPHIIALIIFLGLTLVYFYPLLDGKDIRQMDISHAVGGGHELQEYHDSTGEYSQWTNSMFSGMPAYHVGAHIKNHNIFSYISKVVSLNLSPLSAATIFVSLLSFYILLLVMGISPWIAIAGAIAYGFSTYNLIIINAGHVNKIWAMAYVPLIIAGVIVTYRGKYIWGALLTIVGLGLNISRNHFQITYYAGLIVLIFIIGYFIEALKRKELKNFIIASAILLISAVISILPSAYTFYSNYELGKTSIRSSSELSSKNESQKGNGLDKDYAFGWSYGKLETFTLLIPNFMGGSSNTELSKGSELYKELSNHGVADARQYIKQAPTYWGDMPFTSGPAYHGAIICFLFILGLFILKNNIRWWLLAATILSFMLAWGNNLAWFNDFMFYYFPMYSKFRSVSTSLVIAQFTMPFLAILALSEFIKNIENKKVLLNGLKWSGLITGGICLLLILFGGAMFDFTASNDAQIKSQVPDWFYNALLVDRESLLKSDAFRSLIFILLSAGLLWLSIINKKWLQYIAPVFIVLILIDLWPIAKKHLNEDNFVKKSKKHDFQASVADNFILQDKSPSYRVLNLNNPFNEINTSYFHKSIGGYHGAKQRKYQELIEHYIQPEISNFITILSSKPSSKSIDSTLASSKILNMLNAKYLIYNPTAPPIINQYANGNAWFVKEFKMVENADQEMEILGVINPKNTALIDKRFSAITEGFICDYDSNANIQLLSYKPNELTYQYQSSKPQMLVFSEIYYPYGWTATIDGKEVPHFRTNWTLRGMIVPEGEHKIVYRFVPREFNNATKISAIGNIIILIIFLIALLYIFRTIKKQRT